MWFLVLNKLKNKNFFEKYLQAISKQIKRLFTKINEIFY